jgi:dolichol-phosphate mannosyltransferase
MTAEIWLIIPTYNEAVNLERIVVAAGEQLQRAAPGNFRILIVDDNSPDGTGQIADRLIEGDDTIEVLHRPGIPGRVRARDGPGRRDADRDGRRLLP